MKSGGIPTLLGLLAVLAVPVLAKDGPAVKDPAGQAPAGPRSKLALASFEHDFGKVTPGTPLEYRFEFKNEGDAALQIQAVKAACGCTTASYDTTVASGKTGGITLLVKKTDSYKGPVSKRATVTTNDPDHATFQLTLVADFGTK